MVVGDLFSGLLLLLILLVFGGVCRVERDLRLEELLERDVELSCSVHSMSVLKSSSNLPCEMPHSSKVDVCDNPCFVGGEDLVGDLS